MKSEAFIRAEAEGLSFFFATMHVGHTARFVGQSWEDGGFRTDENGNPTSDIRGNGVANYTVEALDPENPEHVSQVEDWYNG